MNALSLYIYDKDAEDKGQYLVLPSDVSINMHHVSGMWDVEEGGTFSEKVKLLISENRHVLGTAADIHGESIRERLHHKRFKLYFNGQPVLYGMLYIDNNVSTDGDEFEIELVSGNSAFSEMIEGMSCRDVKIPTVDDKGNVEKGAIYIGECISSLEVEKSGASYSIECDYTVSGWRNPFVTETKLKGHASKTIQIQGQQDDPYVYPDKGLFLFGKKALNFSEPYSAGHPFCNIRTCGQMLTPYREGVPVGIYQKNDKDGTPIAIESGLDWRKRDKYVSSDGETIDGSGLYNRYGHAPSFFVMYFLDLLFGQLSIKTDFSALEAMEDFYRLCFVNTNPCFDTTSAFVSSEEIAVKEVSKELTELSSDCYENFGDYLGIKYITTSELIPPKRLVDDTTKDSYEHGWRFDVVFKIIVNNHKDITLRHTLSSCYANSENFPNTDVSSVLEALQNAFGYRMMYDSIAGSIKCMFVGDWLAKESCVTNILHADVIGNIEKKELGYDGYKLKYSASNDTQYFTYYKDGEKIMLPKKVLENGRYTYNGDAGDAYFNYNVFMPDSSGNTISNKTFSDYVKKNRTAAERRVLIDQTTGNAYNVRIDEEFNKQTSSDVSSNSPRKAPNPQLFETGNYIPVEYGDCSKEADGRVKVVEIGFTPLVATNIDKDKPKYALMIGEMQRSDYTSYEMSSTVYVEEGINARKFVLDAIPSAEVNLFNQESNRPEYMAEGYDKFISFLPGNINSLEFKSIADFALVWKSIMNHDPKSDSPIYSYDPGFCLGIMRGPGNGSSENLVVKEENADGESNNSIKVGTNSYYATHADSIDDLGNIWDYNGDRVGGVSGYTVSDYTDLTPVDVAGKITVNDINTVIKKALPDAAITDFSKIVRRHTIKQIRDAGGILYYDNNEEWNDNALGSFGATTISFQYSSAAIPFYLLSVIKQDGTLLSSSDVIAMANAVRNKAIELAGGENNVTPEYVKAADKALGYNMYLGSYANIDDRNVISKLQRNCNLLTSGKETALPDYPEFVAGKLSASQTAALAELKSMCPQSSVDFLDFNRFLLSYKVAKKQGWSYRGGDGEPQLVLGLITRMISDNRMAVFTASMGPCEYTTDGGVPTKDTMVSYMTKAALSSSNASNGTWVYDRGHAAAFIGAFDAGEGQDKINKLASLLFTLYNGVGEAPAIGDNTEFVPVNGRISLKLKAEKPMSDAQGRPIYIDPADPDGEEFSEWRPGLERKYFKATAPGAAKRGLFDKFHTRIAYFLTHCKEATIPVRMSIADLLQVDMLKQYSIGGITGFIKEYKYTFTNDGVTNVTFIMYYL